MVTEGISKLAAEKVCRYLDALGDRRVVFNNADEHPIMALLRGDLVMEESPLGDSNANGAAESEREVFKLSLAELRLDSRRNSV